MPADPPSLEFGQDRKPENAGGVVTSVDADCSHRLARVVDDERSSEPPGEGFDLFGLQMLGGEAERLCQARDDEGHVCRLDLADRNERIGDDAGRLAP